MPIGRPARRSRVARSMTSWNVGISTAVVSVLRGRRRDPLARPQRLELGEGEVLGEPARDRPPSIDLRRAPVGELGVGGDVGRAGDLVLVSGDEHAVLVGDEVGLDVVGAHPRAELVGGERVLGPVPDAPRWPMTMGITLDPMCRNIRPLHNFEPPATHAEVAAASLERPQDQRVHEPSQANQEAFDRAVEEVAAGIAASARRAGPAPRRRRTATSRPRSARPLGRALRRVGRWPSCARPPTESRSSWSTSGPATQMVPRPASRRSPGSARRSRSSSTATATTR